MAEQAAKRAPVRWGPKQRRVIDQLIINSNLKECAEATGASYGYVRNLVTRVDIWEEIEAGRKKFALQVQEKAAVTAADVLIFAKKVYDRCMQEEPVLDSDGNQTGEYKFDSSGANKAVKTMGDHISVRAFVGKEEESAGTPDNFEWTVTVVHTTKEEYDRGNGKPPIEHQP